MVTFKFKLDYVEGQFSVEVSDFYKIAKPRTVGMQLGVLGQRSNITEGSNIKIQKYYF